MAVAFVITFFGGFVAGIFTHAKMNPFGESAVAEECRKWRAECYAAENALAAIHKACNYKQPTKTTQ